MGHVLSDAQHYVLEQIEQMGSVGVGAAGSFFDKRVLKSLEVQGFIVEEDRQYKVSERKKMVQTPRVGTGYCICGCGKPTTAKFAQGHDQRVRGAVTTALRHGLVLRLTPAAKTFALNAHWCTPEMRKLIEESK